MVLLVFGGVVVYSAIAGAAYAVLEDRFPAQVVRNAYGSVTTKDNEAVVLAAMLWPIVPVAALGVGLAIGATALWMLQLRGWRWALSLGCPRRVTAEIPVATARERAGRI